MLNFCGYTPGSWCPWKEVGSWWVSVFTVTVCWGRLRQSQIHLQEGVKEKQLSRAEGRNTAGPWMLCCLRGKQRHPQYQPASHSGTNPPTAGFQQGSELLQLRDGYKGELLWVTQRTFQPPCQCFQAKEEHAHPSNAGTSESRGPPTGSPLTSWALLMKEATMTQKPSPPCRAESPGLVWDFSTHSRVQGLERWQNVRKGCREATVMLKHTYTETQRSVQTDSMRSGYGNFWNILGEYKIKTQCDC